MVPRTELPQLGEPTEIRLDALPDPCPDCGGDGYLEHINVRTGSKHQRCTECGNRWAAGVHTAAARRACAPSMPARRWASTGLAERLAQSAAS